MTGTPTDAYREMLETLVVVHAPDCASFGELLRRVAGAYPADLWAMLADLNARGLVDPFVYARLSTRPVPATRTLHSNARLPVPHPLDYDWRFDAATRKTLIEECLRRSGANETVVFLGVPSLLDAVLDGGRERRWLLLEGSEVTASMLSALAGQWAGVRHVDLTRDEPPALSGAVVVADPPWYPAYVRAFLWCAARMTMPGATLLLAQPGLGTRPGLLDERAQDMAWAAAHGFDLARVHPGAVGYEAPPFEVSALRAAGLAGVDPRWRRGDLIVLRRNGEPAGQRPAALDDPQWTEVVAGDVRLRVRTDGGDTDPADPCLISLTPGDVLHSVSRRDPVRPAVRMWTSGNRVFGCASPALLACLLRALTGGNDPFDTAAQCLGRDLAVDEHMNVRRAVGQVVDLITREAGHWPSSLPHHHAPAGEAA